MLAENLGMKVIFYDTHDKLALGNARRTLSMSRTAPHHADVVTLHVDGRASNEEPVR